MDDENTELIFPVSLVERAENFDALMGDVSAYIEQGDDPSLALDDNHVNDPAERQTIGNAIAAMQRLHDRGRDHIWAYYTRNMVRPVALSRSKVDVVIGNPPWINYNQTADILRDELQSLSRNLYGIWAGGRYATHQDVAGLFFARSVDLYLKDGGVIGFVLPHSALQAGQYSKWRSGRWRAGESGRSVPVDFTNFFKIAGLGPGATETQHFFPVPASVVNSQGANCPRRPPASPWPVRWSGGGVARAPMTCGGSPQASPTPARRVTHPTPHCPGTEPLYFPGYCSSSMRPGGTNTAIVQAAPTVTVRLNPRKVAAMTRRPSPEGTWCSHLVRRSAITGQTVENRHLFDVHLGETIAPYVALEPLKALASEVHAPSRATPPCQPMTAALCGIG